MKYDEHAIMEAATNALRACGVNGDSMATKVIILVQVMQEGQTQMISLSSRMPPWEAVGMLEVERIKIQQELLNAVYDEGEQ